MGRNGAEWGCMGMGKGEGWFFTKNSLFLLF